MKFFTTLFLVLFVAISFQTQAQNVKVKNVAISYQQLPLAKLPDNIRTYSVSVQSGWVTMDNRQSLIQQYLSNFKGYQRVNNDGDIQVHITFRGLDLLSREVIFDTDEETKQAKNYRLNLTHTFPVRLEVFDRDGNYFIDTEVFGYHEQRYATFGGTQFQSEAALINAYETEKGQFWQNYERQAVTTALRASQDSLVSNYSSVLRRDNIRIGYGKGKKQNYADLENAMTQAERAYKLAAQGQDMSEDFQSIILVWETALQEKDVSNKKARINAKIARWLHYNCAMAYTWQNDFENARRHTMEASIIKVPAFSSQFSVPTLKRYIWDKERRYLANL